MSQKCEPNASMATINLASAGQITLAVSVDLCNLSRRDLDFVFGLVDSLEDYRSEVVEREIKELGMQ